MILLSSGIKLSASEYACLRHVVVDPEAWLQEAVVEKARLRQDALIAEWRPRLLADPDVSSLPATRGELCALIFARPDYKTRYQQALELQQQGEPSALGPVTRRLPNKTRVTVTSESSFNTARYASIDRQGSQKTLFPNGLDISDGQAACIQAYVVDIESWIHGALLGQINRGKKKMIAQYHPIIMADPSVTTMPATEDGLITMILARPDYQRLGG